MTFVDPDFARSMTDAEEARQAACFRFVGIDREGVVISPPGMRYVILAAAQ